MILGLQIIALTFSLIMIYIAYLHYKKGEINGIEIIFWLSAWFGAVVIITFPEIFRAFSQTVAISRAFDLAVLGAFVLIIPITYFAYVGTRRLEKKLEELIRGEALKEINKPSKKKRK